jgi:SAM-dependent MidA family methyltransferase
VEDKLLGSLIERLRERIELEGGAISFRDWMEAALYDEQDGYYRRASLKRWGREGDYRTSPERSPLFATTFARFFAALYEELGRPARWTIWEAGAGAGYFARGFLETLQHSFPQIFSATRYVLDETSNASRSLARERLAPFVSNVEYGSLYESQASFETGIVFANELLDAFPVHRVTLKQGRLLELYVGVDDTGGFRWIERNPSTALLSRYLERLNVRLAEGQVAEINLGASGWINRAATLFRRGYVVLVDYGAEAIDLYDARLRPAGSLRAFREHRMISDVLQTPGEQDITATVDWTTIKRECRESGLELVSFESQEEFLLRAGLLEELERMQARTSSEAASLELRLSAREMILPGSMSTHFQVLVAGK